MEGWVPLEVPYAKDIDGKRVQSYCGVLPARPGIPARSACYRVNGLGFSADAVPDPDPEEGARIRLRTYESLVEWFPLHAVSPTRTGAHEGAYDPVILGSFHDRIRGHTITVNPPYRPDPTNQDYRGVQFHGGAPLLIANDPLPLGETNAISLMFRPIPLQPGEVADGMLLYAGDAPYLNEFSVAVNADQISFSLFDGKAPVFQLVAPGVVQFEWNHLVLQYTNGFWEAWLNGKRTGRKMGPRQPFMKRRQNLVGNSPTGHTTAGFTGSIADIRFYSRALESSGIHAINDDFTQLQVRETHSNIIKDNA